MTTSGICTAQSRRTEFISTSPSKTTVRCEGCQPEGSRRYRTIHARDRQLARPYRSVRASAAHRAYIPRWGIQVAAHLSESTAWAIYRDRLKRFGSLG